MSIIYGAWHIVLDIDEGEGCIFNYLFPISSEQENIEHNINECRGLLVDDKFVLCEILGEIVGLRF